MEVKIEFIRDEKFVTGLINLVDKKIENCFETLTQSKDERIKSFGCNDGAMKVNSVYVNDNEILNNIMKLEKIRKDYFAELQDLKPKTN